VKLPDLLWLNQLKLNQLKLVRKLNEQNVFMERKTGFALNAVEMNYAKLMEKTRHNAEIAVDHHFVRMVDKSINAENAVVHHFVNMVKERMDVETAVDLGLVLILITNTNARSVPLLVFDTMFNVVLIVCYWIPTCEGDVNS
jgi:hypothetical protein